MSSKKYLKEQHPWANYNIVDIISKMVPKGSTKYIPLILKEVKKKDPDFLSKYSDDYQYYKERLKSATNFDVNEIENFNFFESRVILNLVEGLSNYFDRDIIESHDEHHKNNRLSNPDISTYSSFEDVIQQVKMADVKLLQKEKKGAIHTLLNDENWLVVIPLTYDASLKYGSNTKWCTTSKDNPDYFYRYSRNGSLYYILSKKTYTKSAVHVEYTNGKNYLKLYDEADDHIDSTISGVDPYVLEMIVSHSKNYSSSLEFMKKNYKEYYDLFMTHQNNRKGEYVHEELHIPVPELLDEEVMVEEPMVEEYTPTTFTPHTFNEDYDTQINNVSSLFEKQLKSALSISRFERFKRYIFGTKVVFVGVPFTSYNMTVDKQNDVLRNLASTVESWDVKYRFVFYPSQTNEFVINKI